MFTGIVAEKGKVRSVNPFSISIQSSRFNLGDSVCVNGVCLTVSKRSGGIYSFDLSEETIKRTNLGGLTKGSVVNIEGAVRVGDQLGGHIVTGHIDCTGVVKTVKKMKSSTILRVGIDREFEKFIVAKGSVAVDGVSLTVTEDLDSEFEVALIPYTLEKTTLGILEEGSHVNIEADIIARYLSKLQNADDEVSKDLLVESGFVREESNL